MPYFTVCFSDPLAESNVMHTDSPNAYAACEKIRRARACDLDVDEDRIVIAAVIRGVHSEARYKVRSGG